MHPGSHSGEGVPAQADRTLLFRGLWFRRFALYWLLRRLFRLRLVRLSFRWRQGCLGLLYCLVLYCLVLRLLYCVRFITRRFLSWFLDVFGGGLLAFHFVEKLTICITRAYGRRS